MPQKGALWFVLNVKITPSYDWVSSEHKPSVLCIYTQVYQDASVEGGSSVFDDKSALEDSLVASSAEPSAARQSAAGTVKTGKLGKHHIIIIIDTCTSNKYSTEIVFENPKSKQHLVLSLSSEAAVVLFHSVNCCPPPDAGTFAKKLLDVFFSKEELARSCCTKATGMLLGIKCMLAICT